MARKLTLADLDFSNPDNNPDWADAIRKESEEAMRQREERRSRPSFNNIVSEVDSTAISPGAFANTVSGSVSSTERQSLEERFTLPNLAAAGVEAIADFVTTPYTEALGDKMGANVDRIVAGGAATVGDASVVNPLQAGRDALRNVGTNPMGLPGAALEALLRQIPAAAKTATGLTQEEGLEIAKQRTASGEARDARADAVIAEMTEGRSTPYKWLVEGTADVAGSASSALSVFGGATSAITFGDIYLQEYGAARAAGLSPDDSHNAALGQATPETMLSVLPTGRIGKALLERIPGVKQGIEAIENRLIDGIETVAGKAIYTGVEAAKTATGESVQEMAASTGQDIVRRFQGLVGEEKAREYAQQNVVALENYPEMLRRSGVAGFMMGGGLRTPTAAVEANRMGEASQELRTRILEDATVGRMQEFNNFVEGSNARTQEREAKAETELDLDIAREEERIRNEEARTAAFEQAEAERAEAERRAAEQKELEEEAGFQTIERDADLPRDRVERYADVVERVPVNPAQEITPEQVQEQRRRETREQVEQQQRAEQGQRIEFLRKRQEAAVEREKKAANAAQEKRAKEARARERKIADEIVAANPNATAAELETAFQARLMQPDPKPQAKKEATPAPVAQQVPTPQPAPQAAPAKPAPKPTVKKADKDATDEELDAILEWANSNLGMAASGETAPLTGGRIAPTVDMEAYKAKVKPLIRNLVKRTSKDSRSFQKLILQDKLRIVPNASTMGFREQGRVAEYDANEGKLYLYTDALEANGDVVPAIARAFHEATHAGQFNDREGRSNLYRHFLGDKKTSEAAKKIRKAAAQGNRLASDALEDAQRDTKARKGDNQYEDLELVAYFTNRVVEGRGSVLGSAAGAVRDITTAARQWLRDGVGLDLEVSLGDLQTAAANVGSEIAETDVRGLRGRDRLGMEDDVRQQNLRAVRAEENITRDLTRGVDGTAYRDLVDRARQLVTAVAGNPAFSELSAYDRAVRTADALENLREVINDRNTPLGRTLQEVRDAARQQAEEAFTARVIEEADNTIDRAIAALEQDNVSEFEQRRTARDLAEVNSSDDLVDTLDRIFSRRQGTRLGMTADDINDTPLFRGSPAGTEGGFFSEDGALGPGYYFTQSRQGAEGYGPSITEARAYVSSPLVINYEDVRARYDGNTALAIAADPKFADENFWNRGAARRWAEEQWEDWAGIGDSEFRTMVRDAGYDSIVLTDGDTIVEINVIDRDSFRTRSEIASRNRRITELVDDPKLREYMYERDADGSIITDNVTDEDIRLGMSRVDAESDDFAATGTPEFRRWFGNSTVVNEDGSPRTMYHGTKDAFNTFRVNDLGLIFASPSETFAEAYAGINEFTLEQNPAIPLYVRAENTWDYENPEHRALLLNNEASMNSLRDYFSFLTREDSANMSAEELDAFIASKLAMGDWDLIEQAVNVEAIKAAGFDSLNVFEGNAKNIAVFEPNQFKHATENKGAWSLDNDNMFGMAANAQPSERRTSARVFDTLQPTLDILNNIPMVNLDGQKIRMAGTGLLRNDKGLGYDILTAWEHAKAWPAAEEARARASLGKYRKGIKRYAAANNMTVEQVNGQIMQELDGIDNQENKYSENKKAWENVLAKYGEAGQHMMDMRNQVDAMSLDMLRSLYSSGRTLSPREMKRLATIAANMGRYTHRMYAAHLGEAGNKYATAVLEAWNKKRKNPNKRLSDAQERSYAVVQNAVEVLINDHLRIPEDTDLFQLDAEATRRLYNTWINSTTGIPVETMQTELADRRDSINGDKNRLDNEAERIVKDLLGLLGADSATGDTATAIGRYYRGGKTDTGILQERKKIPVALRTLMGELDEPGSRMLATVAKQAEFVARTRMLESFKDIASPQDLQPPDATGTNIVRDNDMKQLTGEGYGPLEGWWASPNMQAMIGDVREQLMGLEQAALMASNRPADTVEAGLRKIYEKWTGVAALSKGLQIVGNSFLYPLNFAGSFFMLSSNGNYNPAMWARGWKDASMLIANAANPSVGLGSADLAVRYGVTDSATIGELKGVQYQELQKLINEMAGTSKPVAILKAIKDRGIATATETYAMADVWSKIANFHFEADQLRSYYKANNETRSDDEIYKEAANIVNSTNLSYKRAMPFFKAIERGGITHFGTYFYEVFRSQIHNAARGAWELSAGVAAASTPAAKAHMLKRGTVRLAGQAATWAFFYQASQYLNDMLFGEDDEELRAKRSVLPDFMQNQDLYPYGIGKDGKPVYYGMSRIDPIGPITDIMRESMHGEVSWDSAKQQLLDLYVMPRITPQLFTAIAASFSKDHEHPAFREPLVKQLTPNGYAALANTTRPMFSDNKLNVWINAAEAAFLPGTFNAYRDTNPEIVGPIGDSTGTANAANISRYFGATFVQAQPARMMGQRFKDYDDAMKHGRAAIKNMFSNSPNLPADDALRAILPLVDAERKAWEGMVLVQHGMEAWQLDEDTISDAYSRVNDKRVLRSVRNEEFQSFMIDKTSLDSAKNRELRDAVTAEEKEQVEEKWEAVWETLQVVAGEIE